PPSPKIFCGREAELKEIVDILTQDTARIAILGTGGIGKTTLAMAAVHHPTVAAKYMHRYFVPCHSSLSCANLMSAIATHVGVEQGAHLSKRIVLHFMHASPSLLVLDNLETTWESVWSRTEVEEFLCHLTDVSHLGLLVTMRGAERPGKAKWNRPFLPPLDPLADSAAFQMFMDIADQDHDKNSAKQLLDLTGNLPLAVSLIASVAAHEGCDFALHRWKLESTRMLSDGYDQRSSLDISIMLSFSSSRMTSHAQELLSILSMLPDGLADGDLDQAKLPIPGVHGCRAALIRTSLAFVDKDQRLKVLVPIREYVNRVHPPTAAMQLPLRQYFHEVLAL
ncbi:P-loop containing nucleoside triphosphate hydrolase protein, partial [Mycena rebaudengoi]